MPDLTPPPMSDELIDKLAGSAFEGFMRDDNDDPDIALAHAIECHVNEQWRQRLELRAYESASGMLLGIQNPLPSDTPLYRIKEQG